MGRDLDLASDSVPQQAQWPWWERWGDEYEAFEAAHSPLAASSK